MSYEKYIIAINSLVGHIINYPVKKTLLVPCTVLDVKLAYGKPRALITPTDGEGEAWVEIPKELIKELEEQANSNA